MIARPLKGEVLVVVHGDHHVGSTIGLAPPKWRTVDANDVTEKRHSMLQSVVWKHWEASWKRVFDTGLPVVSINCADNIDGDHHGTYQIWSKQPRDQADVAIDIFKSKRVKCTRWYCVRGTPAHVGQSGEWDEYIAQQLSADHFTNHAFSNYQLRVDISGVLFDVMHHGPSPGKRLWTLGDVARKYAQDVILRCLTRHERPPDVIIRAHQHVAVHEVVTVADHTCHMIITPAWQLKTEFSYRVATTDDMAQIGFATLKVCDGVVSDVNFDLLRFKQAASMTA